MNVWTSPSNYLGLPAEWGRSKNRALQWVLDKVRAKLDGWKETLLNQGGKEVLIKALIQAIPVYAMSIVKFPATFCKKLGALVA
ncbi:hypothetical protein SESBI_49915, partial [Sesbania bispinosa]